MNRKTTLALVLAAFAAGSAIADDGTMVPEPFVSTATRAEVMADLQQFRQSGVNTWADDYNPLTRFRGDRTREEVTREFIASRGTVAALTGEDSGSVFLAGREHVPPMPATQMAEGVATVD